MNFMQSLRAFYTKRFDYHSRSIRSEYWWVQLFYLGVLILASTLDWTLLGYSDEAAFTPLAFIVELIFIVPGTCLTARRLHDVGLTGWAQLPSFLLYLSYIPSFSTFPFESGNDGIVGSVLLVVFIVYFIWLLINLIKDSQPEPNRYGPSPKDEGVAEVFD